MRGYAESGYAQESGEAGYQTRASSLHLRLLWAWTISLQQIGQYLVRKSAGGDLLDAILMARRTLCQFDRTAATARHEHVNVNLQLPRGSSRIPPRSHVLANCLDYLPSVPSDNVLSLSANICIWSARPALNACRSFKFASSAFFSAMRATSAGDWPDGCEPPREAEGFRRWDGSGRPEYDMVE